ncbi:MAG TPA: NHL repeat-containing protein [Candidatus Sulfotelmatobacter sp.]
MRAFPAWICSGFLAPLAVFSLLSLFGCGSGSDSGSNSGPGSGVIQPPPNPEFLWVADSFNNRVLMFDAPFSTGQSASVVLGQVDFTSSGQATSVTGLNQPTYSIADGQGNLWVSDWGNNRLLEYKQPFTSGMAGSLVLGQTDFTTNSNSATAGGLSSPHEIVFDKNGNLWVADSYNNRVVEFTLPFSNGMMASLVLGQTTFSANNCTVLASGLCYPTSLMFDAIGNLWVVDCDNNRVLEYNPPFVTGESASTVLGQADFTSAVQGAGATGFDVPWSVALDANGNVWVSDGGNWRVLEFKPPFSSGQAASMVLGFPNFTTGVNTDLESSLNNPRAIAFDGSGNLFVADDIDSRVMVFAPPFSSGMDASKVIGQPNFTSVMGSTTASGLFEPVGVSVSF